MACVRFFWGNEGITTQMTENKQIQLKETPRAREAFLVYFTLGVNRSLQNTRKELAKNNNKISLTSLKKWSSKYKWISRVQTMDQEVANKAEEEAIKKATMKDSQILIMIKNTMIKYQEALLSGDVIPTPADFRKMWEMHRIEQGKAMIIKAKDEESDPYQVVNIQVNQRILQIVKKAEGDVAEEIRKEIIETDD